MLPTRVRSGLPIVSAMLIAGLFAALIALTVNAVTPHASDDFESGDLDGGIGWDDSHWDKDGSVKVRTKDNPIQGSWHVRIRKDGSMKREVDLTGETQVFLSFWLKAKGFGGSDNAQVIIKPDEGSPIVLQTWVNGDDDNTYAQYTYDLDALGVTPATIVELRFEMNGNKNSDKIFVDDIQIYSATLPTPTPTPVPPTNTATTIPPTPTATSTVPAGTPTVAPPTATPVPPTPTPTPPATPIPTPTNTPVPTPPAGVVTIDGEFADWVGQAFISDPFDDQESGHEYDLHELYWANNLNEEVNYYMIKRQTTDGDPFDGDNEQEEDGKFILFVDTNNDGIFTGSGDRKIEVKHEPDKGGRVKVKVRRADNNGVISDSGWNDWGETEGEGGLRLEFAISWDDLGISLGDVIRMYLVSYKGGVGNPNEKDRLPDSGDVQWSPASIFGPVLLSIITGFGVFVIWWFRGRKIWTSG